MFTLPTTALQLFLDYLTPDTAVMPLGTLKDVLQLFCVTFVGIELSSVSFSLVWAYNTALGIELVRGITRISGQSTPASGVGGGGGGGAVARPAVAAVAARCGALCCAALPMLGGCSVFGAVAVGAFVYAPYAVPVVAVAAMYWCLGVIFIPGHILSGENSIAATEIAEKEARGNRWWMVGVLFLVSLYVFVFCGAIFGLAIGLASWDPENLSLVSWIGLQVVCNLFVWPLASVVCAKMFLALNPEFESRSLPSSRRANPKYGSFKNPLAEVRVSIAQHSTPLSVCYEESGSDIV